MSIVLDVVQKIVLYSAYELTCAAAAQVLSKCRIIHARKGAKFKMPKVMDDRKMAYEKPDAPEVLDRYKVDPKPSSQLLDAQYAISQLDLTYKNCGPICPPKSSMMRLARDSYFS
ncbi:uncharacterized protein LOC111593736 [Drosophila hydei]|uniref:Uncharacterized protein LOC111593736 n=1 Tax=Drosophila hydei TaxID=7224 RepID=A0A6J1L7E0_DROHY|nr:uncharacterized protein LOC111593736 [Drosophila hydei]